MLKIKSTRLGFLVFLLCAFLSSPSIILGEQTVKMKIDEIIKGELKYDLFSGTVLVAENGKIIYSGAFGLANKDYKVKNTLKSRFNIGSIGKTFTATLIMQLVQQGKIKLTDPLSKYIPEFPYPEKDKIQIRHLLNHTSGLDNYMVHKSYDNKMTTLRHIKDVLPLIFDQKLLFQPGEKFRYSNSGMVMLGAIIEKVSGISYKNYLKKQILEPLGMKNSGIIYPEEVVPNRATGYTRLSKNKYRVEVFGEPPAFSDGGLYSTVEDMLKFDRALSENKLLSEKYKKIMFTPVGPVNFYALGWFVGNHKGTNSQIHSGGCPGFTAEFRRFPEKGLTVIVLSNYNDSAMFVAENIDSMLLGTDYQVATMADVNFRKGMNLQGHGKFIKASEQFEKNTRGNNPHLPSLYQSARSKIIGKFEQEKAITHLDRYIKLSDEKTSPPIAAAWWRKGLAFEQLNNPDKAIHCYEKCLELDPRFRPAKDALIKLKQK